MYYSCYYPSCGVAFSDATLKGLHVRNHSEHTYGINGTSSSAYGQDNPRSTLISDTAVFLHDGLSGGVDTYLNPQSGTHSTGNISRPPTHNTYQSANFHAYGSPQDLDATVSAPSHGYSTLPFRSAAQVGEMVDPSMSVLYDSEFSHDIRQELGNHIIGPSYARISPSQIDSGRLLWNSSDDIIDLHHPMKIFGRPDGESAKPSLDND